MCRRAGDVGTYSAGVGTDPRADRYFNLEKQAKNYDTDGEHARLWLPELSCVPAELVHRPGSLTMEQRRQFKVGSYASQVFPAELGGFSSRAFSQTSGKPAPGKTK